MSSPLSSCNLLFIPMIIICIIIRKKFKLKGLSSTLIKNITSFLFLKKLITTRISTIVTNHHIFYSHNGRRYFTKTNGIYGGHIYILCDRLRWIDGL